MDGGMLSIAGGGESASSGDMSTVTVDPIGTVSGRETDMERACRHMFHIMSIHMTTW